MEQLELHQKNKGGRPPKASKRSIVLSLKCSREEQQSIERKARSASLTVSEYLREMGLKGKIDVRQKMLPGDILRMNLLSNMASNLNQIARKRNGIDDLTGLERAMLTESRNDIQSIKNQLNKWLYDR
ncbi:plasmid mobilization protein [Taibaiella koreensis]|uniref:plasmid mobilization protein n=1 Tax=Taibaiella koreensis TaxID=1268548 RepID=UPI00196952E6|nr:mobilization protein [Taibaiella koreensis]